MVTKKTWQAGSSIGSLVLALTATAAFAQTVAPQAPLSEDARETADLAGVQDIVVTAMRMETNLQSTPISVSAVTSQSLENNRVDDVRQLASLAPSLVITGQAGQEYPIALRGISSGSQSIGGDSPVAIYLDGIYLGRQQASLFDLPDIERIEVSRGPQGTLFGRNNTGGAINVITEKPSGDPHGRMLARYGTRNEVAVKGFYTGPITDNLFFKIGGTAHSIDGFERWSFTGDRVNNERTYALNAGLLWNATDKLSFDLRADYSDAQLPLAVRLFTPGNGKYGLDVCAIDCDILYAEDKSEFDQNLKNYGVGLTTQYDVADGWMAKSITGYRRFKVDYIFSNDAIEVPVQRLELHTKSNQFSQELQLAKTEGPLTGVAGLYYFYEKSYALYAQDYASSATAPVQITAANARVVTNSYAAFADGTYAITDRLGISAGIRFSHEKKTFFRVGGAGVGTYTPGAIQPLPPFTPQYDLAHSWDSFSPRVALNYKITPGIFAYATVSKGDKSGGFSFSGTGAADVSFDPEKVYAYEVGLKNTLFNRQLRLNLSAFYYDYKGLQVAVATQAVRTIFNAASARVKGLEAEFEVKPHILPGLTLSGNLSLMDAKYRDFLLPVANPAACIGGTFDSAALTCDLAGLRLPRAPKFQGTFIISYDHELASGAKISPQLKIIQQGRLYYTEQNDVYASKPSTTQLDAQLAFTTANGIWRFTLWGKNLTDKRYIANARLTNIRASTYPGAFAQNVTAEYGVPNAPRAYGVEVSARF